MLAIMIHSKHRNHLPTLHRNSTEKNTEAHNFQ